MRIIYVIFLLVGIKFCPRVLGQNLIPNYSFEDTVPIPPGVPYLYNLASEWTFANLGSPDYFSPKNKEFGVPGDFFSNGMPLNVFGHQYAKSGIAFMGIYIAEYSSVPLLREYLQARLKNTLVKDSTYCLQIYISLADSCQLGSRNQFGFYFSNILINTNDKNVLNFTPQIIVSPTAYITDKVNWLEYNFQYTAKGGERFIVMGNFTPYSNADTIAIQDGGMEPYFKNIYYYIDNVWLSHCDSLPKSNDIKVSALQKERFCYSDTTQLSVKIQNVSVDSIDFTKDTLVIFTEVLHNGTVIQSFQQEIADNTLNYNGNLLGQDSSISIQLNPIDFSQLGKTYQLKIYARLNSDEDTTNNILDTVIVNDLSLGTVSSSSPLICTGSTVTLKSEGSKGFPKWECSMNQTDWIMLSEDTVATHQPVGTTFYRFSICDFYYSDTLQVEVNTPPTPVDTTYLFCKGLAFNLVPSKQLLNQGFSWFTSLNDTVPFFEGDTLAIPFSQNQIFYIASKVDSCLSLERGKVTIDTENCGIIIPNVFTPNGDGVNDFFFYSSAVGSLVDVEISTTIFNRWGEEVATWEGNVPWDGDDLLNGTYFYRVTADGVEYKGSVMILR